jgi:hypothetical protein
LDLSRSQGRPQQFLDGVNDVTTVVTDTSWWTYSCLIGFDDLIRKVHLAQYRLKS